MPKFDPDAPMWWNLVLLAAFVVVVVITTWATNRKTRAKLHEMGNDIAASRQQVENEHADGDFPNLRDEITEIRKLMTSGFEDNRTAVGGIRSEVRDLRKDVTGLRDDARQDRRELAKFRTIMAEKD